MRRFLALVLPVWSSLLVPDAERAAAEKHASELRGKGASLEITEVDQQWVHVLSEGWAAPLEGFMTEQQYLQSLHFEHIFEGEKPVSMAVPIVLPLSTEAKGKLEKESEITLVYNGVDLAILSSPEFFEHNKEERSGRTFGITHEKHPHIELINNAGDWLVGGKLKVLRRIVYNDGMDQFRLTPSELQAKFKEMGADAVFVFQLRNPVHNGHALLMQDTARRLKEQGYKKPVLWLSPLGGWTKDDDVPLDTRMAQHHAIIKNGVFGDTEVVLAIFPSPMLYAGPREVQWHAKARLNGGATHYIVGRDPAGMKHPGTNEDIYHMWHGQRMLEMVPELASGLKLLPFKFASYDKTASKMAFFDPARKDDFVSISGSKMRKMAREGTDPPQGFMDPEGWSILKKFYAAKQEL
mmetsp:Transcript_19106/g.43910  ORF Transcript_19106/g.43910 Transcript_19106/m.43910 type:complete len:409 (+) Transcript_19106:62-1288(+)